MENKLRTNCLAFGLFFAVLLYVPSDAQNAFKYPVTPIRPISDTIFGKIVIDNYRWLEKLAIQKYKPG